MSESTSNISLLRTKQLVFMKEMQFVFCEVGNKFFKYNVCEFHTKRVNSNRSNRERNEHFTLRIFPSEALLLQVVCKLLPDYTTPHLQKISYFTSYVR
jgi:hypothetical protein